jgi:hypothetical protein
MANADAPLTGSESAARLVGTATAGGVAGGSTDSRTATIEAALPLHLSGMKNRQASFTTPVALPWHRRGDFS